MDSGSRPSASAGMTVASLPKSIVLCPPTAVLVLLLAHRDRIGAGKPAVQVDVGTTPAAERAECVGRRLATGRTQLDTRGVRAHSIGHGTDIRRARRLGQAAVSQPNRIG